jgi:predicted subunit of tRNA(5-methylaminomethyl-2-thiouridylate) methyltransferase
MDKKDRVAILYSGGTDSTCTAAMISERFGSVHMLTLKRLGFYSIENTFRNVDILREKFPAVKFLHKIIDTDRLARYITRQDFARKIFRYGFFTLSNCLICGLINHFAALIYCLDNSISNVADGSTREWSFFPTHMEKIILELKSMYAEFNINYDTPVYDFNLPKHPRFIDKILPMDQLKDEQEGQNTTGEYLFKLGILPFSNLKGSVIDHNMQPRCFQFVLHHIYVFWFFMARHNYDDYEEIVLDFFKYSISRFVKCFNDNPEQLKKLISYSHY